MGDQQETGAPDDMAFKPFDADALIDALVPVLQLKLEDEYRPGIRNNLKVAAKMAALIEQIELDDEVEPAPVFRT